jgi:hypothetical protein
MRVHANAKLGPAGRLVLVQRFVDGASLRAAAQESSVSVATAHRWRHRWREATVEERSSGVWLRDRSSRPHRSPRRLMAAEEAPILRARERTGLGPARLAGLCRRARSTIWKVLWRHGKRWRVGFCLLISLCAAVVRRRHWGGLGVPESARHVPQLPDLLDLKRWSTLRAQPAVRRWLGGWATSSSRP